MSAERFAPVDLPPAWVAIASYQGAGEWFQACGRGLLRTVINYALGILRYGQRGRWRCGLAFLAGGVAPTCGGVFATILDSLAVVDRSGSRESVGAPPHMAFPGRRARASRATRKGGGQSSAPGVVRVLRSSGRQVVGETGDRDQSLTGGLGHVMSDTKRKSVLIGDAESRRLPGSHHE